MNQNISLIDELRAYIKELETRVAALRISRRVLTKLLDNVENEKREQLLKLESENEKLQKNNTRYAKTIMYQNSLINKLENKLKNFPV